MKLSGRNSLQLPMGFVGVTSYFLFFYKLDACPSGRCFIILRPQQQAVHSTSARVIVSKGARSRAGIRGAPPAAPLQSRCPTGPCAPARCLSSPPPAEGLHVMGTAWQALPGSLLGGHRPLGGCTRGGVITPPGPWRGCQWEQSAAGCPSFSLSCYIGFYELMKKEMPPCITTLC